MVVNHQEIWAGDGDSTLKVFALDTGTLLNTISTGGTSRLDEMCFDPVDNIALMANDADSPPFITFVNGSTKAIIKKIVFDGAGGDGPNATNGIEQCQKGTTRGTASFYINLPEVGGTGNNAVPGQVVVIRGQTLNILAAYTIPVTACSGPQGMAIGPAPQILLGCNGGPNQPANGYPTAIIDDGTDLRHPR